MRVFRIFSFTLAIVSVAWIILYGWNVVLSTILHVAILLVAYNIKFALDSAWHKYDWIKKATKESWHYKECLADTELDYGQSFWRKLQDTGD